MSRLEEVLRREVARGADARTIAKLLSVVRAAEGGNPDLESAASQIMAGDRSVATARRYLDAVVAATNKQAGWRRVELFEEDAKDGPLAGLRHRAGSGPFLLFKVVPWDILRRHDPENFDAIMSAVPSTYAMNVECKVVAADLAEFDDDMTCDFALDLRPLDGEVFDVVARAGRRKVELTVTVGRGENFVVYHDGERFMVNVASSGLLAGIEAVDDEDPAALVRVERAVRSKEFLEAAAAARARLAARPRRRVPGRRR